MRVLQSRGVAPERLAVIGYGEQRPIQSNDTEQGRNANRRVVVVILSTELQRQKAGEDPSTGTATPAATPAPAPTTAATDTPPVTTRVQLVDPAPAVTASTPAPNSPGMVRAP